MKIMIIVASCMLASCTTIGIKGKPVAIETSEIEGTYWAPLMLTWGHSYTFNQDGTVRYDVSYDSWEVDEDGMFVTGHYFEGTWILQNPKRIVVNFE